MFITVLYIILLLKNIYFNSFNLYYVSCFKVFGLEYKNIIWHIDIINFQKWNNFYFTYVPNIIIKDCRHLQIFIIKHDTGQGLVNASTNVNLTLFTDNNQQQSAIKTSCKPDKIAGEYCIIICFCK